MSPFTSLYRENAPKPGFFLRATLDGRINAILDGPINATRDGVMYMIHLMKPLML